MIVRILGRIGRTRLDSLQLVLASLGCGHTAVCPVSNIPPVSMPTPPVFFNFGIPAANKPPNCGAALMAAAAGASLLLWSLLLLALLPPGTGGASPPGLAMPGTGGAPARGDGPGPPDTFPTCGAERSLVTAFFRAFPLLMSARRAP